MFQVINVIRRHLNNTPWRVIQRSEYHFQIRGVGDKLIADIWPSKYKIRVPNRKTKRYENDNRLVAAVDKLVKDLKPVFVTHKSKTRLKTKPPDNNEDQLKFTFSPQHAKADMSLDGDELRLITNTSNYSESVRLNSVDSLTYLQRANELLQEIKSRKQNMPTQVPIEVFMIGQTVVNKDEVARWMKHIGAEEFVLPPDEAVTNPALLIALAGKRCYQSFTKSLNPNITRIRQDYVAYFDNILKSGHGSVLEHSVYNFAIEGVSRVFTAEMNRHRAGWAISEGSLRFIRFGENIPYWVPDSISGEDVIPPEMGKAGEDRKDWITYKLYVDPDNSYAEPTKEKRISNIKAIADKLGLTTTKEILELKRNLSRMVFENAFNGQEKQYRILEAIWADELSPDSKFAGKKQVTSMMRRIVGLGVATGGVWSGNIRALRHVFAMRASAHAEEEMIHVFSRVVKTMAEKEPLLFGDFYKDDDGFWRPEYVKV